MLQAPQPQSYKNFEDYWDALDKFLKDNKVEPETPDTAINNGGKTSYYQLTSSSFPINDADDFAEWRQMNFSQGNILKVVWTFNTGRHQGTDYERDLNKIIHYAKRELGRLNRESKQ